MSPAALRWTAFVVLLGALSAFARAADEAPLDLLVPSDAQALEGAGNATALAGDLLAVGRPGHDPGALPGAGAVDLLRFDGTDWVLEAQLLAPDGEADDRFGTSVALSPDGQRLAVGAERHAVSGATYVFLREPAGWALEQKLAPPTAVFDDRYGAAVALEGDLLLVGAPWRDVGVHPNAGSVFAYRLDGNGWTLEADLVTGSEGDNAFYGSALDVDGDTVAVGAPNTSLFGFPFGCTHVLRFDGSDWQPLETIKVHSLTSIGADFGVAVALEDGQVVAGAPYDDANGLSASGSAFVFEEVGGAWSLLQQITDPDGVAGDAFGSALDLDGERLVISSPQADPGAENQGAAVFFRQSAGTWLADGRLEDETLGITSFLGGTVDLDGDLVVMGAGGFDGEAGANQGAVEVFDLLEPQWAWLGLGLPGDAGTPVLSPSGELAAGQPVELALEGAAPSAPVALVLGAAFLGAPLKGGVLVPTLEVFVGGLTTGAAGELVLSATWPAGIPVGLELFVQAWIADATGPVGFSASHGLRGVTS